MSTTAVSVPAAGGDDGGSFKCACNKDSLATIILILALAANALLLAVGITGLLSFTAPGGVQGAVPILSTVSTEMLNVDLIVLALVMLAAELRIIRCVRSLVFPLIKHFYFVTTPIGRGVSYLFLASLAWDPNFGNVLALLALITLAASGVLTIFVHVIWGMPVFVDALVADALVRRIMQQGAIAMITAPPAGDSSVGRI